MTPETLRNRARSLGARCDICPLSKEKPVASEAPRPGRQLKLVLVGEGPGRHEVKTGRPFVGFSGKLLDQLLVRNQIRRAESYITNAALCRGEGDRENDRAAVCCAPRLLRELSELPVETPIITLGKSATLSVLGIKSSFLGTRGFVWSIPPVDPKKIADQKRSANSKPAHTTARAESDLKLASLQNRALLGGRIVLPTLHPAFVLRAEIWHAVIRLDFARIGKVVRGEIESLPERLEDQRARPVTLKTARSLSELALLKPTIALDVETTQAVSPLLAKLLCVGLSDGRRTFVVWPWKSRLAMPLSKFLKTRAAVVAHNMPFDRTVLESHGVGP